MNRLSYLNRWPTNPRDRIAKAKMDFDYVEAMRIIGMEDTDRSLELVELEAIAARNEAKKELERQSRQDPDCEGM